MKTQPQQPPADAAAAQPALVQDLLVQVRQLKIENARLEMEVNDARESKARPDPRLRQLEAENQRLRSELIAARSDRDQARQDLDQVEAQIDQLMQSLERITPGGRS